MDVNKRLLTKWGNEMDSTKEHIIMAGIKGVRQYGLEGVRVQNISKLAGLTQGAMYRYFKSKDELMEACFFYVDKQVAELFEHISLSPLTLVTNPKGAIKELWLPYFRFWTSHPDETIFYHRFRDSAHFPEFDKKRDVGYFETFVGMVKLFRGLFPSLNKLNADLLWLHVLTSTIMYAKYVVEGVLPNNEETENEIFQLMVSGLAGYLKRGKEADEKAGKRRGRSKLKKTEEQGI